MLGTYKFLFFISFFKKEYNKWPNFAAQLEQMVKNCPSNPEGQRGNWSGGGRLDHKPVGNEGAPLVSKREGSTVSIGLLFFVSQRFFLLRARTGHVHDQIEQSCQQETEAEKAEKHFRLPVHEEKEA
jgi:hypothetical protein